MHRSEDSIHIPRIFISVRKNLVLLWNIGHPANQQLNRVAILVRRYTLRPTSLRAVSERRLVNFGYVTDVLDCSNNLNQRGVQGRKQNATCQTLFHHYLCNVYQTGTVQMPTGYS